MITKTDIAKLEKTFATKDGLHNEVTSIKELIMEFKDIILKEIRDMRDEIAIVIGYKDQIEDHETRLETIEKRLQIPQ